MQSVGEYTHPTGCDIAIGSCIFAGDQITETGMKSISSQSLWSALRGLAYQGAIAGLLPLPALFMARSSMTADLAALYLGLASAWLAADAFRDRPVDRAAWLNRMCALGLILSVNVGLFGFLGVVSEIESHIPFPLIAGLAAVPALGLIPWLTLKLRHPYQAIVLGGACVGGMKILGCIVARIIYGPDALRDGFMAADWRTAPVMIGCFWVGTILVSSWGLFESYRDCCMTDDFDGCETVAG